MILKAFLNNNCGKVKCLEHCVKDWLFRVGIFVFLRCLPERKLMNKENEIYVPCFLVQ